MKDFPRRLNAIVGGCFAWSFSGLAGLVPSFVRRAFRRGAGTLVLDLSGPDAVIRHVSGGTSREIGRVRSDPLDTATQASTVAGLVKKVNLRKVDVVLRLPASQALRKTLNLPLAAEENLRQVLAFEMDRQTPFSSEEVYFDFTVRERDRETGRIKVEMTVVPRSAVDEAIEAAVGWGLHPDVVDVAGTDPDGEPSLNLMPRQPGAPRDQPGGALSLGLAAVAVVLAAVALNVPLERQRDLSEELLRQVAAATSQAHAASASRAEIERSIVDGGALVDRKAGMPTATGILAELTRLMPDDTWISQFQLRDTALQVSGYSADASRLIGLVENSPLFHEAKFRSPVTQDARTGRERFNLSAEVAMRAPR